MNKQTKKRPFGQKGKSTGFSFGNPLPPALCPLQNNRGQFSVMLIAVFAILLATIGLAVDVGRVYFAWTGNTRALDAACAAVYPVALSLSDDEIRNRVDQVAKLNLRAEGYNIDQVTITTTIDRRPELAQLLKLKIEATLNNYPSIFLSMLEVMQLSTIKTNTECPVCYDNPTQFNLATYHGNPITGPYEAGLACQEVCNNGNLTIPGTSSCCSFTYGWTPGAPGTASCICAASALQQANTQFCDPNAQAPAAVDPDNPGIGAPVWINRTDQDALRTACENKCQADTASSGTMTCADSFQGTCQGDTGVSCCTCACGSNVCTPTIVQGDPCDYVNCSGCDECVNGICQSMCNNCSTCNNDTCEPICDPNTQHCEESGCVDNDPCYNVYCEPNDCLTCNNGSCDSQCGLGDLCNAGSCEPDPCYAIDCSFNPGTHCENGACVADPVDACGNTCDPVCQSCDETAASCVDTCDISGGFTCNPGVGCEPAMDACGNICDPTSCQSCDTNTATCVGCDPGFSCISSTCQPDDACGGVCNAGNCETCDAGSGTCVGCDPGFSCVSGACQPDDACGGTCDSNNCESCDAGSGTCVGCDPGFSCVNGACE